MLSPKVWRLTVCSFLSSLCQFTVNLPLVFSSLKISCLVFSSNFTWVLTGKKRSRKAFETIRPWNYWRNVELIIEETITVWNRKWQGRESKIRTISRGTVLCQFKVVPGRFGDRNLWNRPWVQEVINSVLAFHLLVLSSAGSSVGTFLIVKTQQRY